MRKALRYMHYRKSFSPCLGLHYQYFMGGIYLIVLVRWLLRNIIYLTTIDHTCPLDNLGLMPYRRRIVLVDWSKHNGRGCKIYLYSVLSVILYGEWQTYNWASKIAMLNDRFGPGIYCKWLLSCMTMTFLADPRTSIAFLFQILWIISLSTPDCIYYF